MEELVQVPRGVVATLSPLILRTPHIEAFLGAEAVVPLVPGRRYDAVVGWGRKRNADWAARYARWKGIPFFRLEDGFLRSVGLGREGDPPWSMVVDDLGIYYDARRASRLRQLLASDDHRLRDPAWLSRSEAVRHSLRQHGLSKYNSAQDVVHLPQDGRQRVLVVDQVAGDLSLRHGGVAAATPRRMLLAALAENPAAHIFLKAHPQGELSAVGRVDPRIRLLPPALNPVRLLEQVDRVYVMTSLLGFEALLHGVKRVSVFGRPFYAGWGVTDDRVAVAHRGGVERSVAQLFMAAYLLYSRYVAPADGRRVQVEEAIEGMVRDVRRTQKPSSDPAGPVP